MAADVAGIVIGFPDRDQAAARTARKAEHERSVDEWAAANGIELAEGQRDRMVKFLNDWTRP